MSSETTETDFGLVSDKHDLTPDQKARYSELFRQLDVNSDGRICVEDLQIGLEKLGVHTLPGHAQVTKFIVHSYM